jgi:hypothetical protein
VVELAAPVPEAGDVGECRDAEGLAPKRDRSDPHARVGAERERTRRALDEGLMPAGVVAYECDWSTAMLAEGQVAISFGGRYEAAGLAEALGVPLLELSDHVGFVPRTSGIVRSVEPLLGERELRLVVQLWRDDLSAA